MRSSRVRLVEEIRTPGSDAGSRAQTQLMQRLLNLVNESLTEASASPTSLCRIITLVVRFSNHWLLILTYIFGSFCTILIIRE